MARIGIDARKAADFGIGRYIERLVAGLAGCDGDEKYALFGGEEALAICRTATGNDPRFTLVRQESLSYSLGEHFSLPRALRRARIDLYHSTHYVLPHGPLPARVVTSVHDLIHLIFPQYLPSRAALIYARHFIRRAARRSDAVITGSVASRDDLLHHVPAVDSQKVHVIPYGVDQRFRPAGAGETESDQEQLKQLGLQCPYFLYVGNFKPHKNLAAVLEAYGQYQALVNTPHRLVLVGRDLSSQDGLNRLGHRLPDPHRLLCLGYQPDQLLPLLYRGSELFLFPSLYEGFGLPPLEALACGTPVLASRGGALEEVLGPAAHYCDPNDTSAMAQLLKQLTDDPETGKDASRRGPERALLFDWNETARRTLDLYRSLLDR